MRLKMILIITVYIVLNINGIRMRVLALLY